MAKAIITRDMKIRCDTCGTTFPGEVADWHHKACPECGAPDIINDADVAFYKSLVAAADLLNVIAGDLPDGPRVNIPISTARLHAGGANEVASSASDAHCGPETGIAKVLADVRAERVAQDAQWGGPEHDDAHDFEDFASFIDRQVSRYRAGYGSRERFIKIAALAVAAVESFDRRVAAPDASPAHQVTPDVVRAFNEWQSGMHQGHPYTCPNRGDGHHHNNGIDLGCLVATPTGWICPDCDYAQPFSPGGSTVPHEQATRGCDAPSEALRRQFEDWQLDNGLDKARLARDGRYPAYYGNPTVQAAWEGFREGATRGDYLLYNAVTRLRDLPIVSAEWAADWCKHAQMFLAPGAYAGNTEDSA